MQELLRKTIELIRKRPILLLPLLVADQTALYLNVLRRIASKKIVAWSMTTASHSVTGAIIQTPVDPYEARNRAILLLIPLDWATYFIRVALFTAAFVLTAYLIRHSLVGIELNWRESIVKVRTNLNGALKFAIKFLVLYYAASLLLSLPAISFNLLHYTRGNSIQWIASIATIVQATLVAWIMAPPALRLLNQHLPKRLPVDIKRRARLLCIACAVAADSLSFGVLNLKFSPEILSSFNPWFWNYPIPSLESAIVALPYLPMWIALALLAFGEEPMIEIPSPS
jgi:hypothetical protein